MWIRNRQLTAQQYRDLLKLMAVCQAADGGLPKIYTDLLQQERDSEGNLLCYQNDALVALASTYFFYNDACELTLLVAPSCRQPALLHTVWQTFLPLWQSRGMQHIILSLGGSDASRWLLGPSFVWQNSEYHMRRELAHAPQAGHSGLVLRLATEADIPSLCALTQACFEHYDQNTPIHLARLLRDPHYSLLLAERDGQVIGKAHVRQEEGMLFLSDIAVFPQWQGQGLGTDLVAQVIQMAIARGQTRIGLDVESNKRQALNLYLKLGFDVKTSCEYWRIPLTESGPWV